MATYVQVEVVDSQLAAKLQAITTGPPVGTVVNILPVTGRGQCSYLIVYTTP